MKRVAVIGEGAWGTAMACALVDAGQQVNLWCHDAIAVTEINQRQTNAQYAPGIQVPPSITAYADIGQTLANVNYAFISTPLPYFRAVLQTCVGHQRTDLAWVCLSKGIEQDTQMLASQIVHNVLGKNTRVAVLSGPSFAREVLEKKLTAVTVASADATLTHDVMHLVASKYFRPFASDDVVGVQLGGALKNAVCVLLGIAQGRGYADNTIALIFTRAWQEMHTLAHTLGARTETLSDLSGIGDLMLTYTGQHSRNVAMGRVIGKSANAQRALAEKNIATCEGLNTIKTVMHIAQQQKLNLPVFTGLYGILFNNQDIDALVRQLAGLN